MGRDHCVLDLTHGAIVENDGSGTVHGAGFDRVHDGTGKGEAIPDARAFEVQDPDEAW
ncbi:MAG: hypothetical protein ACFB6R_05965 [Alphaproteobacteria bacterium]